MSINMSEINNFVKRIVGKLSNQVVIKQIENNDTHNRYEYYSQDNHLVIAGDTGVSIATALHDYLKKYCNAHYSWCGNNVALGDTLPLPKQKHAHIIPQKYRVIYNFCTYGYSMVFWDWTRWEKELDFIALNGFNMPLALIGTDAVWYYALIELGLSQQDSLNFICNPAYFPWQAMTNIEGIMPPQDEDYIQQRLQLGKKIIDRMVALGMTPIQQGFTGFVPTALKKLFPNEKFVTSRKWIRFDNTTQVIPTSELFQKLGKIFLDKQRELFGAYGFYATDPFHESAPPIKGKKFLVKVAQSMTKLMNGFDKNSIMVMQSWSIRKDIVTSIPKGKLLILDINSLKHTPLKEFYGHDFILGRLDNFGQRTYFHGNIKRSLSNEFGIVAQTVPNVVGTGLFMEGSLSNPLYYDALYQVQITNQSVDTQDFVKDYCERRYGAVDDNLIQALNILVNNVYVQPNREAGYSSIICSNPCFKLISSSQGDDNNKPYDPIYIQNALCLFVSASEKFAGNYCYEYDLADLTRQFVSNQCIDIHKQLVKSYKRQEQGSYQHYKNVFIQLLTKLDNLLANYDEMSFYKWIEMAHSAATNDWQKTWLDEAARRLLTIWGPVDNPYIFDYASREWAGLIQHFYLPRWLMFFEQLEKYYRKDMIKQEKRNINIEGKIEWGCTKFYKELADWQINWTKTYVDYPKVKKLKSTVALTKEIIEIINNIM